jgi:hypothetical protein
MNPTIQAALRQANSGQRVTLLSVIQDTLDAKASAVTQRAPAQANLAAAAMVVAGLSTGLGAAAKHSQPKHRIPLAVASTATVLACAVMLVRARPRKATAA